MRVSDRTLRWVGVVVVATTLALGVIAAVLSLSRGSSLGGRVGAVTLTDILVQGIPYAAVALTSAVLVWRVPRNAIGWIFWVAAAAYFLQAFADEYAVLAFIRQPGTWPLGGLAAWFAYWLFAPGQWALPLALLLFPSGRALSTRWGRVVVGVVVVSVIACAIWSVLPTSATPAGPNAPFVNPVGQPIAAALAPIVLAASGPGVVLCILLGLWSLVLRYRRSDQEGRHQLKWFLYAAPPAAVGFALQFFTPTNGPSDTPLLVAGMVVSGLSTAAIPAAIAIAILKYRLYDIDVVISRTLVYGSLAALITGVYVGIAVGIGELVGSGGKPNLGLSILATAIVAVGFQPARQRLQLVANRLVYGRRATPYQVLSKFSSHVAGSYAADEVLPRMARVLQEGAGAESATVWLRMGGELHAAAAYPVSQPDGASPASASALESTVGVNGTLPRLPGATSAVEVRHQGELLGALAVTKRRGESLTPVEEKLLTDLAHQAGLVLKNVGLTADLQRRLEELRLSRQRLVSAQDAERRRLERNLHDGAQQHLVALKVKLGLAEMLAAKDPEKAKQTLQQLKVDTDEALETLRDLARGIYPPLLAEKGLATALESQARKATLEVTVHAEALARYPQDVEATVYFCVLEALQNVQKYARASHADIRVSESDGELRFEVEDNGRGFDTATVAKGSGLTNMLDRVDSVGGTVMVTASPGNGTTVAGRLPLPALVAAGAASTAVIGEGPAARGDAAHTAVWAAARLDSHAERRSMPA